MIIIPDIHGRTFWKDAIKGREDEEIIFLGDYLDPYDTEKEWKYEEIEQNFREIIEIKKQHPQNVTLLLGNHDGHYAFGLERGSRYDFIHAKNNGKIFKENSSLFQMAYEKNINDKRFIFSHAGITKNWLENHRLLLNGWTDENIVDWVNELYLSYNPQFFSALEDISHWRYGYDYYGSMVWADIREFFEKDVRMFGDYQIFGHTQLKDCLITDKFADLDCRRAFELKSDGKIYELNGELKTYIKI